MTAQFPLPPADTPDDDAPDDDAPDDDAALLGRYVRDGDGAAYAELVRRFGPLVRGTCRRRLTRREDAEDAAQTAFLALARRAGEIRDPAALPGWLHRVAHRAAARAATDRPAGPDRPAADGPNRDATDGDALAALVRREALAAVDEELLELPAAEYDALVLCCLRGLPRAEAAARLGVTEAAVKGRLARGRRRLRRRLVRRGVAPALAAALPFDPTAAPAATPIPAAAVVPAAAAGKPLTVGLSAAVCLATALASAAFLPAHAADDPARGAAGLPEEVRTALAANAAALDPIAVTVMSSSATDLPADAFRERSGWESPDRPEFAGPRATRYAHAAGRTRGWQREQILSFHVQEGEWREQAAESERAFDGERVFAGSGATAKINDDPALGIFTPAQWRLDGGRGFAEAEYLRQAGFAVPTTTAEALGGARPASRVLAALGEGGAGLLAAGPATVDGRAAFVVRVREAGPDGRRGETRFVLDPAANHAVVLAETFTADGRLRTRTRTADFRPVGDTPLRLPRSVTVAHHLARPDDGAAAFAEPIWTDKYELTAASADPLPADAFVPEYPPGAHVTDRTDAAGTIRYQIPEDPAELDATLADARTRATPAAAEWLERLIKSGAGWIAGLLALLAAAAAAALRLRG